MTSRTSDALKAQIYELVDSTPSGVTVAALIVATGADDDVVSNVCAWFRTRGMMFALPRQEGGAYFATVEAMAEGRPAQLVAAAARRAKYQKNRLADQATRTAKLRAQYVHKRGPRVPKPPKAVKLAPSPTPKLSGVNVPSRSRKGWGPTDPMHVTENTKFTYASPLVNPLRTNTHSQY